MSSVQPVRRGRGRPRSQAAEDAILRATLELLAQGGYQAVTVDKVAARASTSKATIYRRWPTKENLVLAAFELTEPLDVPCKRRVADNLVEIIWQFTEFVQTTPLGGVLPALVAERRHNPTLDEALVSLIDARRQPMLDVVQQGIERGEFKRKVNPEFVVDLCVGPVELRSLTLNKPVDKPFVRRVVQAALASLLREQD